MLEQRAAGVGLRPDQLYEFTPREFNNYCSGTTRQETELFELYYKSFTRKIELRIRDLYTLIHNVHSKRSKTARQLMPFDWEKEIAKTAEPTLTKNEGRAIAERYKQQGLV